MSYPSAPVLFLIFNRPDLTQRVFERIREIRPQRLFIAADGPRPDRPGEDRLCEETREVTRFIDWECEVQRLERSANLGCKLAVSSAISWFFEHVEEGIILEDDCLPDPSFFHFCTELLETYRHHRQVGIVSGDNYQKTPCAASYYFSRYPHIWGWATWRRFWRLYDVRLSAWNGKPESLAPHVRRHRVRKRFAGHFDAVKEGRKDTWDYQLVHLCLKTGSLCINPARNLVANLGFDERGTHTVAAGSAPPPAAASLEFPLVHPARVEADDPADFYTETHVQNVPANLWASWRKSLHKRIQKLRRRNVSRPS